MFICCERMDVEEDFHTKESVVVVLVENHVDQLSHQEIEEVDRDDHQY